MYARIKIEERKPGYSVREFHADVYEQIPEDADAWSAYLADARRVLDEVGDEMNAIGIGRFVAALIVVVQEGYCGRGNERS